MLDPAVCHAVHVVPCVHPLLNCCTFMYIRATTAMIGLGKILKMDYIMPVGYPNRRRRSHLHKGMTKPAPSKLLNERGVTAQVGSSQLALLVGANKIAYPLINQFRYYLTHAALGYMNIEPHVYSLPIIPDAFLINMQAKDKGQRRIDYRLFKIRVLPMLARKAGISIDETKQILAAAVKLPLSGSNNSDGSTSNPSKPRNSAETSLPVVPSELVEIFQAAFALFAAPGSNGSAQVLHISFHQSIFV